ncbi:MAG TPA: AtpZ/AtpI family protein [Caulobacteraceae bacterium]|jgi:ATP synthase protein I|nr:AtpZ/AtpI family protein [Caulobacteraceae bacterium]
MPKPDDSGPNEGKVALNRLGEELDAFEAKRARGASPLGGGEAGAEGYRLVAGLIGGLLGGLGLGWFFDRIAHTAPFGLIGGLLIGIGLSTYSAVRTAGRMSARASAKSEPKAPAADDDED